ncbi:MAG: RNA polymerase sigma factor for flagellar operon FliA [Myxococcota bacterium]|jgi:RNA polymerase sigma factor for flagellar operon FliA
MSTQYEAARVAAAYGGKPHTAPPKEAEPGAAPRRLGLDMTPREIVEKYSPLVYRIAKRVRRRTGYAVELDDLVCEGVIGLLQAAERFDADRETEFEHLASVRVHGAMLDALRRLDPLSQRRRREARKHQGIRHKLEMALNREPTALEMSEALGLDLEQYHKLSQELATQAPVSLDDMALEPKGNEQAPDSLAAASERGERMKESIETLPEKQKVVLSLIYYNELSQKEVAQVLEVTEARISQIHKEALERLRRKLRSAARPGEDAW